MTKDEALALALEVLTIQLENSNGEQKYADAIKALAQPVQPAQRPWVGLTDEEKETLAYDAEGNTWMAVELAETKLKEKNT
jgi:hypothetical protein